MIAGVADTHAALWYLLKNPRLSTTARVFMDDAANVGNTIAFLPSAWPRLSILWKKVGCRTLPITT